MSDAVAALEPRRLWSLFAELAAIPRPSKHEERVRDWVRRHAERAGFAMEADATGNLVVRVPASAGREDAGTVILQSHLDMVCEKNQDVAHDFLRDPLRLELDGEWLRARGTTLGADNGIGVAAALAAALDPAVSHGPLELLFTVDEETGLTGAQGLDATLLRGRTLLNLDSEEDGTIFVGCAGGADCQLVLEPARERPRGQTAVAIAVRGLRGGHSGLNIHANRGNAVKLLVRALTALERAGVAHELASLSGGAKHNAIPREADAVIAIEPAAVPRVRQVVAAMLDEARGELAGVDGGLSLAVFSVDLPEAVLAESSRRTLVDLLAVLPHGVLAMSRELPGLVETSSNLAVVTGDGSRLRIVTSSRSSVMPSLRAVVGSIRAAGRLAGADVTTHDGYPGWKPNLASPALAVVREVYAELWGKEPEVTAVHAGLECGLLGEKVPGLDMVSFGPQIEGAHSPDERVHVPSVARFFAALGRVLGRL